MRVYYVNMYRCLKCGREWTVSEVVHRCVSCGSTDITILEIKPVEVSY